MRERPGLARRDATGTDSLQRQIADLVRPLAFEAQLGDEQDLLDGAADRQILGNLEHVGHGQAGADSLVSVPRRGGDVVGQENAALACRPLEHFGIARAGESPVLRPQDIHFGVATEQAAHDVVVEVFVRRQG